MAATTYNLKKLLKYTIKKTKSGAKAVIFTLFSIKAQNQQEVAFLSH